MNMTKFAFIEQDRAVLYADMNGTNGHEEINGGVFVFNLPEGLYFALELSGLPKNQALPFHVHEGTICANAGEKAISLALKRLEKGGEIIYENEKPPESVPCGAVLSDERKYGRARLFFYKAAGDVL